MSADRSRAIEPSSSLPSALLREARPRQWTKNLLVFAAPAAGSVIADPSVVAAAVVAFIAFCLAASGTYYLNDAMDVAADRLHAKKRLRPVAAGIIPVGAAKIIAVALLVASVAAAAGTGRVGFVVVVVIYVALTILYSLWLKRLPVVDVMVVASGFILRAVGGGVATGIELSEWFLIVASFAALFVVTGKRHAEVSTLGGLGSAHRAVLTAYTPELTRHMMTVSATVTTLAYCLWAFEQPRVTAGGLLVMLSIIPFVMALFRYAMLVFAGQGGEPEEIVLSDRPLQLIGLLWLVLLAPGIWLG